MSDQHRDRFDLGAFVLGYLEEQGSVVMPPAFGVYDVLMPEELAGRLGIDDYQHIAFGAPAQSEAAGDAMHLTVTHPLVETIAQAVTRQPANGRAYINGVRVDKRGLAELARKTLNFPNARLDEVPKALEQGALHHYLYFNFKATFVSEEKQEELATVVMDVQAGHAVRDAAILRRLDLFDLELNRDDLPDAPPRWAGAGPGVSDETLQALLLRAEHALRQEMSGQVAALVARMERHLTLDLARVGDYYDELTADLQRRRARLGADDAARSQNLDDKLAALEVERGAKLQDVRGSYAVRVELELVNVLLLTQPKVILPVAIGNRTTQIVRSVVWDPLVHRLEPLVCDVCGQPGEGLHLCTGGHLAHATCLAPQCVDCKRVFCQLCAAQVTECVVCHRPVCRPSLITCPTCGRGTCREHQQLCHAANGEPAAVPEQAAPPPAPKPPVPAAPPPKPPPAKAGAKPAPVAVPRGGKAKPPVPPAAPVSTAPVVTGVRINVEVYETEPKVIAYVMRSTNRVLAKRSFVLTPKGILVNCECEKTPSCRANGFYHRPFLVPAIVGQVEAQLLKLQQEYLIPAKKVKFYYMLGEQVREEKRLVLPEMWHDAEQILEAIHGFDRMVRSEERFTRD